MFDGILNVYKEKGYTSHDVVAKLRGILHQKKIGHTGTLDPDAEGVLPVCLGKATRLCDMLTDNTKTYRAVLLLGLETDTQDISGKTVSERKPEVSGEEVREAVMGFVGEYDQIPPMYSALKVNGKKLYELARAGKTVERQPRQVTIHEIVIESVELPRVTMTVRCSKGTYIRTLCHDIGQKLGCGGCMESLVRTQVGRFFLEDSLKLGEIENLVEQGILAERIVSIEAMFEQYLAVSTVSQSDSLVQNGNPLKLKDLSGTFSEAEAENVKKTEAAQRDGDQRESQAEKRQRVENRQESQAEKRQRVENRQESQKDGDTAERTTASGKTTEGNGTGRYYRVYDSGGTFMGIYEWKPEKNCLTPWKMFLGG